jgi:hypothetical protein
MTDLSDQAIRERLDAHTHSAEGADWDDVLRRARRAQRGRFAGALVVVVAAVVVTATALGLDRTVVDWFTAEPAPERVQLDFLRLSVGAPAGMDPHVIPNAARKITVVQHEGMTHVLWVAPTERGGFCMTWTELYGGCVGERSEPPPPPEGYGADLHPFLLGATYSSDSKGVVQMIGGSVLAEQTDRLVAEYADGASEEIPILWVSAPIDAGFYLRWIPADHQRPGHQLTALVAEDTEGDVVARQTFLLRAPPPDIEVQKQLPNGERVQLPAKALADRARPIIDFRAENGERQTLWLMPSRDGGSCYVSNRGSGCRPKNFKSNPPLATGIAGGGPPVLFEGQAGTDVAVVELRFQDGDVERIEPVQGFIFHAIPSRHYALGHRLELAVALDQHGRELARRPYEPHSAGVYPCEKPVDQGYGEKMCP